MSNPIIRDRSGTDEHVGAQKGAPASPIPSFQRLAWDPKQGTAPESPHGRLSLVTADRREGPMHPPVCPSAREKRNKPFGFGDRRALFLRSFVSPVARSIPLLGRDSTVEFLPTSLFRTRSTLSLWCRTRLVFAVHANSFPAAPPPPLIPDNLARQQPHKHNNTG
jgi:hypothetical protein